MPLPFSSSHKMVISLLSFLLHTQMTLPGLNRFCGSMLLFRRRISSTASGPFSWANHFYGDGEEKWSVEAWHNDERWSALLLESKKEEEKEERLHYTLTIIWSLPFYQCQCHALLCYEMNEQWVRHSRLTRISFHSLLLLSCAHSLLPVQEPSIEMALCTSRSLILLTSFVSSSLDASKRTNKWKLPSPTWPTSGYNRPLSQSILNLTWREWRARGLTAIKGESFKSFFVSSMHSAWLIEEDVR